MESITAFPLSEVNAVQVSDGGTQMLLHARDGRSREVVIAVPYEHLRGLLGCTAIAVQRCERAQKIDAGRQVRLDAAGAELGVAGDGVLTVNLEREGRIPFHFDEAALRSLYEVLHARFGA